MARAGLSEFECSLAARVDAALREVGATDVWALNPCTPWDDPSFTYIGPNWRQPGSYGSDDEWIVLWQAFGVAQPGYVVPCLACYLDGSAWSEHERDLMLCEAPWPSRDCGRDRENADA